LEVTAALGLHILEIAKAVLLRNGYSGLAMEAVAAEAGVSRPTLYSRYPDRAHLFRAVVLHVLDRWKEQSTLETLPSGGTLEERLERFAKTSLDLIIDTDVGTFSRLVEAEAPRFPEVAQAFWDLTIQYGLNLLKRHIVGSQDVTISGEEAESLALCLYEMMWGWHSFRGMRGKVPDDEERTAGARQCVRILLHGALPQVDPANVN
jgi:AcrR family transcriptional regulator